MWGAGKQIVYAIVFVAALDVFSREPRLLAPAVAAMGLAGTMVGLLAMAEWVAWRHGVQISLTFKHGTMVDADSLGSTVAHVNFLSGYLILVLPLLVALALSCSGRTRIFGTTGAAVMFIALLSANSMGSWLGLAAAGVLVVTLGLRGSVSGRGRLLVAGLCAGVMMVGAGIVVKKVPAQSASISVRLASYRIGLAAIAERPFLGFGANGYRRESLRLEGALYGRALAFHRPTEPLSAHASYLDVAVERGLLGLVAFLGVLLSILVPGVRSGLRDPDPERRVLLLGLVAGLTAFALQALTENLFSYSKIAGVFWIAAAALVALSRKPSGG
jgi:O-antigen ligase